jgi:hypothetical protein
MSIAKGVCAAIIMGITIGVCAAIMGITIEVDVAIIVGMTTGL